LKLSINSKAASEINSSTSGKFIDGKSKNIINYFRAYSSSETSLSLDMLSLSKNITFFVYFALFSVTFFCYSQQTGEEGRLAVVMRRCWIIKTCFKKNLKAFRDKERIKFMMR